MGNRQFLDDKHDKLAGIFDIFGDLWNFETTNSQQHPAMRWPGTGHQDVFRLQVAVNYTSARFFRVGSLGCVATKLDYGLILISIYIYSFLYIYIYSFICIYIYIYLFQYIV